LLQLKKQKQKLLEKRKKSEVDSIPIRKSNDDDIQYESQKNESVGETKEGTGEKIKETEKNTVSDSVSATTNKAKELWETTQEMVKETAKDVKDTYKEQISEGTQKIKDLWEGAKGTVAEQLQNKNQDVKEFVEKKTEEAKELYNEASEKGWTKMASEKIAQAKESLKKAVAGNEDKTKESTPSETTSSKEQKTENRDKVPPSSST